MVGLGGKNSSSHVKIVPISRGALYDLLNISPGNDLGSKLGGGSSRVKVR